VIILFFKWLEVAICLCDDSDIVGSYTVMKILLVEVGFCIRVICSTFFFTFVITFKGMNILNIVLASQVFICHFSNIKRKINRYNANIYLNQCVFITVWFPINTKFISETVTPSHLISNIISGTILIFVGSISLCLYYYMIRG
jgi:hypothetical protein